MTQWIHCVMVGLSVVGSLVEEHRLAQQVRDMRAILLDIVKLGYVNTLETLAHGLNWYRRIDTLLKCDHLAVMAADQVLDGKVAIGDRHHTVKRVGHASA